MKLATIMLDLTMNVFAEFGNNRTKGIRTKPSGLGPGK